jgi:hypothetical protein
MNIVSRAEWGAKPARSHTALRADRVTMFVLHHTTGTYASHATVRSIQAFHQGPERKWADVGYNFLIAPTGEIFEGRGWGYAGAHARGHNSASIGVAYIGDGRKSVPEAAKRSVLLLAAEADRRFGKLKRVGHRDVGATACPGDVLYQWWMGNPTLAGFADARESVVTPPPSVPTPERAEVSAESVSARPEPIVVPRSNRPAIMDGWMARLLGKR